MWLHSEVYFCSVSMESVCKQISVFDIIRPVAKFCRRQENLMKMKVSCPEILMLRLKHLRNDHQR